MRRIQIVTKTEVMTFNIETHEVYKWINAIEQNEGIHYRLSKTDVIGVIKKSDIISYTITMGETDET